MSTEDAMVVGLAQAWPELSTGMRANHCILAARVVQEVGAYFGVPVTVRATEALCLNAKAWELLGQDVPVGQWPDDAWSVGVTHAAQGDDGYSGHVVAETPRWFVDLSAAQFSRPKKAMEIDGPLTILKPADYDAGQALHLATNTDLHMTYMPSADTGFRRAPDWRRNYKPVTAAAIRHLRAIGVHQ